MLATDNQTEPSTPPWPSLYDPLIEFYNLPHRDPIQPGGHYLKHAGDVFQFTFYWTLIFHSLFFLITGGIACFNIVYPSRRDKHGVTSPSSTRKNIPEAVGAEKPRCSQPRKNVHRSRAAYALFTLLTFLILALAASFVESAVIGYVLWAVFHAGHFNISTWLPPVWALIIVSSDVLGAFPSVIDRI